MLDPTIRARVAELVGVGVRTGDAIGIAAHEQQQKGPTMTDPNETVAYVHGSDDPGKLGTLFDGGTLIVNGAVYDIPAGNAMLGDPAAPMRIEAVLAQAGYRLAAEYQYAKGLPDRGGVFEVRVVPA